MGILSNGITVQVSVLQSHTQTQQTFSLLPEKRDTRKCPLGHFFWPASKPINTPNNSRAASPRLGCKQPPQQPRPACLEQAGRGIGCVGIVLPAHPSTIPDAQALGQPPLQPQSPVSPIPSRMATAAQERAAGDVSL